MEILLLWCAFGIGASYVASQRGKDGVKWFFIGCLLGPIGMAMAFAAKSDGQPRKAKETEGEPAFDSVRSAWFLVIALVVIAWLLKHG